MKAVSGINNYLDEPDRMRYLVQNERVFSKRIEMTDTEQSERRSATGWMRSTSSHPEVVE